MQAEVHVEEFHFSEHRMRVLQRTAMICGTAFVLMQVLRSALLSPERDVLFLLTEALIRVSCGIALSALLAYLLFPKLFRGTRVRIDTDSGHLLLRTPFNDEEQIALDDVTELKRRVYVNGDTAVITLVRPPRKTRLVGFDDMDRLYDVITASLPPRIVVTTRRRRRLLERWLISEGRWFLLLLVLLPIIWKVLDIAASRIESGQDAVFLFLILVYAGSSAMGFVQFRKLPRPAAKVFAYLFLVSAVLLMVFLFFYWFRIRPVLYLDT